LLEKVNRYLQKAVKRMGNGKKVVEKFGVERYNDLPVNE
jgi:hypothetical protein